MKEPKAPHIPSEKCELVDLLKYQILSNQYNQAREEFNVYKQQCCQVTAFMMSSLDAEATQKLRLEKDFQTLYDNNQYRELWTLIKKTFSMDASDKDLLYWNMLYKLTNCWMKEDETIQCYAERFNEILSKFDLYDLTPPPDGTLKKGFMQRLDVKRYRTFIQMYIRGANLPDNLNSAIQCVIKWDEENKQQDLVHPSSEVKHQPITVYASTTKQYGQSNDSKRIKSNEISISPKILTTFTDDEKMEVHNKGKLPNHIWKQMNSTQKKKWLKQRILDDLNQEKSYGLISNTNISSQRSYSNEEYNNYPIYLDNGATLHIFGKNSDVTDIRVLDKPIRLQGVNGSLNVNQTGHHQVFGNGIIHPLREGILISQHQLLCDGFKIEYDNQNDIYNVMAPDGKCYIFQKNNDSKLYQLATNLKTQNETCFMTKSEQTGAQKAYELHCILGHPNFKVMKNTIKANTFKNCNISPKNIDDAKRIIGNCITCAISKITKMEAKPSENMKSNNIGEVQHMDIFFFTNVCFLLLTDQCSGFKCGTMLTEQTHNKIAEFIISADTFYRQFNKKIDTIRCDSAPNFTSSIDILSTHNIEVKQQAPYEHEHLSERNVRTIKNKMSAIINDSISPDYASDFPVSLISHVFQWAINCCNITNNSRSISPRYRLTKEQIDLNQHLKFPFGALVVVPLPDNDARAKHSSGELGIVVGCKLNSAGTLLIILNKQPWNSKPVERRKAVMIAKPKVHGYIQGANIDITLEKFQNTVEEQHDSLSQAQTSNTSPSTKQSTRLKKRPKHLDDYHVLVTSSITHDGDKANDTDIDDECDDTVIDKRPGISLDGKDVSLLDGVDETDDCMKAKDSVLTKEKIGVKEAFNEQPNEAKVCMEAELRKMIEKEVFTIVNPSDYQSSCLIRSSWVVTRITNSVNKSITYKFRLVANGNGQDKHLYRRCEISSPTAQWSTILMILQLTASKSRSLHHYDVNCAYLNASIERNDEIKNTITMKLNKTSSLILCSMLDNTGKLFNAYKDRHDCITVLLGKAIYGLLQSGVLWYNNLRNTLSNLGYTRSSADHCLFVKDTTTIITYVDDLLLSTNNDSDRVAFETGMEKQYGPLKKNDKILRYIGVEIKREIINNQCIIRAHQQNYIQQLVESLDIHEGANLPAPKYAIELVLKLSITSPELSNPEDYQSVLAKLNWIACHTRPDIRYITSILGTVVKKPTEGHYNMLLQVVKYLQSTITLELIFHGQDPIELKGYCDASFMHHGNCSSHTGIVIKLGNRSAAIFCQSVRQRIIAQSSFESEIIALNQTKNEILYLRQLAEDIGIPQNTTLIHEDNAAVIDGILLGRNSTKSKHIDMRYYSTKQYVDNKVIQLTFVNSEQQCADALTKSIDVKRFVKHREVMLGESVYENDKLNSSLQNSSKYGEAS